MRKLESRPSRERAWEYVFWVDLDADAADPAMAAALDELAARGDDGARPRAATRRRSRPEPGRPAMLTSAMLEVEWLLRRLAGRGLRDGRIDPDHADPAAPADIVTSVVWLPPAIARDSMTWPPGSPRSSRGNSRIRRRRST